MRRTTLANLYVRRRPGLRAAGVLRARGFWIPVAIGRGGISANKREGDGSTPRGRFRLLRVWWRADRSPRPSTRLPVRRIARDDAWCEDPRDRRYNRPVKLDASRVNRLSGLCLQVLLSARNTWTSDNVPIALEDASAVFSKGWSLYGATPFAR